MGDLTDADLDSVLIGGREHRPIVVVGYDERWPSRYEGLAQQVVASLKGQEVSVHHIGSTAVPGLAAKPIIDLLLVVQDVEAERDYVQHLEEAGFVLRVREPGHRMFRTPKRDVHLHVLSAGAPEITDYLDFRDWLRTDQGDRVLYSSAKQHLARQDWSDMNYYAEAKSGTVLQILERARRWRNSSNDRTRQ